MTKKWKLIFFNQEIESNGKTFFKEISNLKSGHFGKIIKNKISFFRYWQLENKKINQSNLQKINNLRELFKKVSNLIYFQMLIQDFC